VQPLQLWVASPVSLLALADLGLIVVAGVNEKTTLLLLALAVCALLSALLGVEILVKYVRFRTGRRYVHSPPPGGCLRREHSRAGCLPGRIYGTISSWPPLPNGTGSARGPGMSGSRRVSNSGSDAHDRAAVRNIFGSSNAPAGVVRPEGSRDRAQTPSARGGGVAG
jgi:hypothetical protein